MPWLHARISVSEVLAGVLWLAGKEFRLKKSERISMYIPSDFLGQDFYAQKQVLLERVLAIAILSVCLSVRHTGGLLKDGGS